MDWLSKGWIAYVSAGSSIYINGQRVCNIDTMTVLERKGLIYKFDRWSWKATEAGKAVD